MSGLDLGSPEGIPRLGAAFRGNSSSSLYSVGEYENEKEAEQEFSPSAFGLYDVFRYVPLMVLDYLSMVRRDW
jgi:hypothetical protein